MKREQRAASSEKRVSNHELRATSHEQRWYLLYAGVLLFLILQILLYAWFTEVWR